MSLYEVMMLVCFGAAWPASIWKSFRSKSTAGKSLVFLVVVDIGYVAGVIHKLLYNLDAVVYLYILNTAMVFVDIVLYWRNRMYETADTGPKYSKEGTNGPR